jgi:hypothetical protein
MFWEAAKSDAHPEGYETCQLPNATMMGVRHNQTRTFRLPTNPLPARVTMAVHIQAIGTDVIDDLVASKDLDPKIQNEIATHTLEGTRLEWRPADGFAQCVTTQKDYPLHCPDDYQCLLFPDRVGCKTK